MVENDQRPQRDELKFTPARLRGDAHATLVDINWRFRETILDPCTASRIVLACHLARERTRACFHAFSLFYASLCARSSRAASFFSFFPCCRDTQIRFGSGILSLSKCTVNIFHGPHSQSLRLGARGKSERSTASIPILRVCLALRRFCCREFIELQGEDVVCLFFFVYISSNFKELRS